MENQDLEKLVYQEWALKAIELLPQEKKDDLILSGLYRQIANNNFQWEARKAFERYAEVYIAEYLQKDDFQDKIKNKVFESVDKVFSELINEIPKRFANSLKWAAENVNETIK